MWNFWGVYYSGIHFIKTVDISRKTYRKNSIETIVDEILRLNEKHMKEGLDHKNLWEIITKYKLEEKPKKQVNRIFRQKISNESNYGLQNNNDL